MGIKIDQAIKEGTQKLIQLLNQIDVDSIEDVKYIEGDYETKLAFVQSYFIYLLNLNTLREFLDGKKLIHSILAITGLLKVVDVLFKEFAYSVMRNVVNYDLDDVTFDKVWTMLNKLFEIAKKNRENIYEFLRMFGLDKVIIKALENKEERKNGNFYVI